jgi:hypothetical protein
VVVADGEAQEVPPYTKFQDMEHLVASEKDGCKEGGEGGGQASVATSSQIDGDSAEASTGEDYTEETYDGYQAILKADWGSSLKPI